MQFNSYSYLSLLLVAVLVFWSLPVRFRRGYVLALSFGFYAMWSIYFLIVPAAMCAIAFWSSDGVRRGGAVGKRALWMGIGAIVAILGVFKYGRFASDNLSVLGSWLGLEPPRVIWGLA